MQMQSSSNLDYLDEKILIPIVGRDAAKEDLNSCPAVIWIANADAESILLA